MNLHFLSRDQRLILLALVAGNLIVLCLLTIVAFPSLRGRSSAQQVTPAIALVLPTQPSPTDTFVPAPAPSRTPQPTNTRVVPVEDYSQRLVDQIIEQVVRIRGLGLATEVSFSLLDQEQMSAEMRALYSVEGIRAEVDREWLLYKTLGLVSEDMSISDEEIEHFANRFAGLYVPERDRIYIVADHINMNAEDEVVFAHEYTHALQDQNFDLGSYLLNATSTDTNMAARALAEGDATVVMAIYAYGNTTQAQWEYLAYRASFAEDPMLELPGMSERAGKLVAFPYQEGAYFVVELLYLNGWASVNQAFTDPPHSTEQVLHPEKYYGSRDLPQEVPSPATPGDGWQLMLEDTMGEFVLSVHLDEFLDDPERAARVAAGWDGDRIAVWQDAGGRSLALWQLVWDSSADAAEFEDAYRAVISARFEGAPVTADTWWETASVAVGMLREGDRVWVAWGPDKTTAAAALEAGR